MKFDDAIASLNQATTGEAVLDALSDMVEANDISVEERAAVCSGAVVGASALLHYFATNEMPKGILHVKKLIEDWTTKSYISVPVTPPRNQA